MSFKYSLAERQNAVRKPQLVTGGCQRARRRQPAFSGASSRDHQQTSAARSHKGKCRSARNSHADFGEVLQKCLPALEHVPASWLQPCTWRGLAVPWLSPHLQQELGADLHAPEFLQPVCFSPSGTAPSPKCLLVGSF